MMGPWGAGGEEGGAAADVEEGKEDMVLVSRAAGERG